MSSTGQALRVQAGAGLLSRPALVASARQRSRAQHGAGSAGQARQRAGAAGRRAAASAHAPAQDSGRVVKHIEAWDVDPGRVVRSLLRPAARMPTNRCAARPAPARARSGLARVHRVACAAGSASVLRHAWAQRRRPGPSVLAQRALAPQRDERRAVTALRADRAQGAGLTVLALCCSVGILVCARVPPQAQGQRMTRDTISSSLACSLARRWRRGPAGRAGPCAPPGERPQTAARGGRWEVLFNALDAGDGAGAWLAASPAVARGAAPVVAASLLCKLVTGGGLPVRSPCTGAERERELARPLAASGCVGVCNTATPHAPAEHVGGATGLGYIRWALRLALPAHAQEHPNPCLLAGCGSRGLADGRAPSAGVQGTFLGGVEGVAYLALAATAATKVVSLLRGIGGEAG